MYKKVKNTKSDSVIICKTRNGKKNLKKSFNDNSIFIHSNYDPLESAKTISEYVSEQNNDIIIFFGMGLAYELKETLKRNSQKKYIIIEPDIDIFKAMLKHVDIRTLFSHVNDIVFSIDTEPQNIISNIETLVLREATINVNIIALPAYQYMYKQLLEEIYLGLKKTINLVRVNVNTVPTFDRQWVLNYAVNTRALYTTRPVEELKDNLKGLPVIIVGAGPSLEYNLEHLKQVYNKAIIVAAGSGVSVLNNYGIKVHFAGAMDSMEDEMKIFQNMGINKDVALLYSTQVYNGIPLMLKGPKFLINQVAMDIYTMEVLGWKYTDNFSGPSITNVLAYNFASLGCSPVILLGQDMCYSNNKNYAKGATFYEESDANQENGLEKVKNLNGEDVFTTNGLLAVRYSMETIVRNFPKVEFLNGSKKGLHIDGSKDIDFNLYADEILLKYQDSDIEQVIGLAFNKFIDANKGKNVSDFITGLYSDLRNVVNLANEALTIINGSESIKAKESKLLIKERELESNSFYRNVMANSFKTIWEFMYHDRKPIEKWKPISESIMDKGKIMLTALEQVHGLMKDKDDNCDD